MEKCATCQYFKEISSSIQEQRLGNYEGNPQPGYCFANPPVVMQVMVPVQSKVMTAQPQMTVQLQSVWPTVHSECGCRLHQPRHND